MINILSSHFCSIYAFFPLYLKLPLLLQFKKLTHKQKLQIIVQFRYCFAFLKFGKIDKTRLNIIIVWGKTPHFISKTIRISDKKFLYTHAGLGIISCLFDNINDKNFSCLVVIDFTKRLTPYHKNDFF